jgi:threonine dehydrogenase-like Zn-dependent dehydrogenase
MSAIETYVSRDVVFTRPYTPQLIHTRVRRPVCRYLPELIDLVWNRKIHPGKVFDLILPLDQMDEGYWVMDKHRTIKVQLRP